MHPFDVKIDMATDVVRDFHGSIAASEAAQEFRRVFRERQTRTDIQEVSWEKLIGPTTTKLPLARLIFVVNLTSSRTEAERLIRQGAVEWDGKRIDDPSFQVSIEDVRQGKKLKVGKLRLVTVVL
jgi:tyrosyl-tRNA synthetase